MGLGLRSGLGDYVFLHQWFLAVYHGRRVLAALLLHVVVLIIIIVPIVSVLVIVTNAVVRQLYILFYSPLSEWRQDYSNKPSVSGCDSAAPIYSDKNLIERLVLDHHSRLVPFSGVASGLVLDRDSCTDWNFFKLAHVPLKSGAVYLESPC